VRRNYAGRHGNRLARVHVTAWQSDSIFCFQGLSQGTAGGFQRILSDRGSCELPP